MAMRMRRVVSPATPERRARFLQRSASAIECLQRPSEQSSLRGPVVAPLLLSDRCAGFTSLLASTERSVSTGQSMRRARSSLNDRTLFQSQRTAE